MSDIIEHEPAASVPAAVSTSNYLSRIQQISMDPAVDVQKLSALLDIQERLMKQDAENQFNIALGKMADEMPRIRKNGTIDHGQGKMKKKYATYDDIDDVLRPMMISNGFSLRFTAKERQGGGVVVAGTLSHRAGHSITGEVPLGIDTGGAKNNVQGIGSSISYGKRYLVTMFFNLVFEGDDDDGKAAGGGKITDEQAAFLKERIRALDVNVTAFLKLFSGAQSVDDIDMRDYDRARIQLEQKEAQMKKVAGNG